MLYSSSLILISLVFTFNTNEYYHNLVIKNNKYDLHLYQVNNISEYFDPKFLLLKKIIKGNLVYSIEETKFVYLLSFLSGISFNLESYSGKPLLVYKDYMVYNAWYRKNKNKIKLSEVRRGLQILDSNNINESQLEELKSLKVH